jgi:tellurite resistance protein
MLEGLQLMRQAELGELLKLTHAKQKDGVDEQGMRSQILSWAGKVVECSSQDPAAIEWASLQWLARHWGIDPSGFDDNDELERALRIRIADDASQYLSPIWWVSCVLIAAGPADAVGPKVRLLEKAASLVVPSRSARQKLTEQWREKCTQWGLDGLKQPEVQQALEQLRKSPERVEQAVTLAAVISLADGRLAMEEERLLRDIAEAGGLSHEASGELVRRVNNMYWGHQVEVTPKRGVETPEADKLAAMQAAQLTLDSAGTLEGLCLEACDNVVGLASDSAQENAPRSGWQRVLGTVSGLKQFFSNRMRSDEQVNLVRLVYLSIIHQHAEAANKAEAAAAAAAAAARQSAETNPVVAAASTGEVGPKLSSRSIKLD